MSDKFNVPDPYADQGDGEAETKEGVEFKNIACSHRADHLGDDEAAETEEGVDPSRCRTEHLEEDGDDEDEETDPEETDCHSRYGDEDEEEDEEGDDDEAEEPSHPDAPAPPDMEEIAEIVAAAVGTATAPLIAQVEQQAAQIAELASVIETIDIGQAIDGLAAVVEGIDQRSESAITRLDGVCDRLDGTLSHAKRDVRSAILSNEHVIVERQRAMMNFFLSRSSMSKRDAAVAEFCTSGETIETQGIETQILANLKPWALR